MGCLNSTGAFPHRFANIHFSGPCNRACYFCIGQHMMGVDHLDSLDVYPVRGYRRFIDTCRETMTPEVYLTGTNTDPALYQHLPALLEALHTEEHFRKVGLRTNGVRDLSEDVLALLTHMSLSCPSMDPMVYAANMGHGYPPDVARWVQRCRRALVQLRINVVLTPSVIPGLMAYLQTLALMGVRSVNLREPYGQAHVGNPLADREPLRTRLGMPVYDVYDMDVMYWDVHYVEVESVNLYANGHVSLTYPVSKGHDFDRGIVRDQTQWGVGRQAMQWLRKR